MSTPTAAELDTISRTDLAYIAVIRKREKALARAVLPRIAFLVRRRFGFRDAVSIHTTWSDYERGQVPDKILGPHGRILWTRDREVSNELDREVCRYIRLRPASLRLRADRDGGNIIRLPRPKATA